MFHTPATTLAATTSEMMPNIQSRLSKSWQVFGKRSQPTPLSRRTATRDSEIEAVHDSQAASDFTRWLSLIPPQSLRSTAVRQELVAGNGFMAGKWSSDLLSSANPFQSRRSHAPSRSYSTFPLSRPAGGSYLGGTGNSTNQRRTLFGMGHPSQSMLRNLEINANNHPTNASAQGNFYSALLRANMPEIIVQRYGTNRFATNKVCEEAYTKALQRVGATIGGAVDKPASEMSQDQLRDLVSQSILRSTGQMGTTASSKNTTFSGTGTKQDPIRVMVDESWGTTIFKWTRFIIAYGLLGYFTLVAVSMVVETTGILKKGATGKNNQAKAEQQSVRFTDVHGCEEAKEELQELVEFLKNPARFSSLGGKLPKGILLAGPPGTGKTLLARAVAGEAGVPFFYMSGSEFDELYVGVGAKRMRELFMAARSKAPAIVFIDELDAVGAKRNERDPNYVKQTLNQLLTELDGFSQDTGVIVLAATNFPQMLDKALTRPGRFDRNIEVPLPDVRGRMKILQHYMKRIKVDSDIRPEIVARSTPGFSGAQLESLVNQAAVRASKNHSKTVNMLDLEWAKDKIMMGAEKSSMFIQDKDKLVTAYHEAGHTLVAVSTANHTPLYKATIMPRGPSLGATHFIPEMDKVSNTKAELVARLDALMGGKVAEEIVYGPANVTSGCSSDLSQATDIAYSMVTQYGMSDALGGVSFDRMYNQLSTSTRERIEYEVKSVLDGAHARAVHLLTTKRKDLDTLANALIEYEVLNIEEIRQVLKGEKLQKMKAFKGAPLKLPELVMPPAIGGTPDSPLSNSPSIGGQGTGDENSRKDPKGKPASPPTPPSPPAVGGAIEDGTALPGPIEGVGTRGRRKAPRGETAPVEERNA